MNGIETGVPHIGALLMRAHAAEQTCIRHVSKALECVQGAALRELWCKRLQLARARADMLTRRLARCGNDHVAGSPRVDDCLLAAMELALRNGDLAAAEAVARECVALADIQCACAWRKLDEVLAEANVDSACLGAHDFGSAALPALTSV